MERKVVIKRMIAFAALAAIAISGTSLIRPAGADFAQQGSYGGISTGAANAQVISLPGLAVMTQLRGVTISFIVGAGFTNTEPATIAINNGSTTLSAVAIERMNSGALLPLGGAEMPAGRMVKAFFDGTEFVLETDYTGPDPVGSSKIINYTTPDPGYVIENGQCLSQAAEPALFGKYGTQYNTQDGCTSAQFGVDDKRGLVMAEADTIGGSAAGRLSSCSSGLGAICGIQSSVVAKANLASFTMSGSGSGSISGTASGSLSGTGTSTTGPSPSSPGPGNASGSDLQQALWGIGGNIPSNVSVSGSLGVSGSASTADTINSGGGSTPLSLVQPTKIVYYEAKL